jgi:hypothetical protein
MTPRIDSVSVTCSACGTVLPIPESANGTSVPCPKCSAAVEIPVTVVVPESVWVEPSSPEAAFSFEKKAPDTPRTPYRPQSWDTGERNIVIGAAWLIGGLVVTAFTYRAAREGGVYIYAWGAIAVGGLQFAFGLVQYFNQRRGS